MPSKKFLFFLLLFPITAFSQTVNVKKETSRIKGDNAEGYEVILQATEDEVNSALMKFLKPVGKTKETDEFITINEPTVEGKKYLKPLYASARQIGNTTAAWIGINPKDWDKDAAAVEKDLENLAYDFGISFYRGRIQVQIDESSRALQIVERQQTKLDNQNKDLLNKIENNKKEKIQLEKSLVTNKVELETLSKKLEQNKNGQDSVAGAGDQIKKVVEMHKESQRRVH